MANKLTYGFATVVNPEHKGKGLGKRLFRYQVEKGQGTYGNASTDSIKMIQFNTWHFKVVHFTGLAHSNNLEPPKDQDGFQLREAIGSDLEALLKYDQNLTGIDRRQFTKRWVTEFTKMPKSFYQGALIAVDNEGNTVGYGCLRGYDDILALMPVYADSDSIAYSIMYNLVGKASRHLVYFSFPAQQRTSRWLTAQLQSAQWSAEYRNFNDTQGKYIAFDKALRFDKAYAVHDFWPI